MSSPERAATGVWELTVEGRGFGTYSGYRIDGQQDPCERFDASVVVDDPYARADVSYDVSRQPTRAIVVNTRCH